MMHCRHLNRRLALPACAAVLVACGDGTGPARRSPPGVTIVGAAEVRDTVDAQDTLVVAVADSAGAPRHGVVVTFRTMGIGAWGSAPFVWLRPLNSFGGGAEVRDTTDARGLAQARVVLGPVVGTVAVTATADDPAPSTTMTYVIRAGAPVALRAFPKDSAVYAGRSYTMRSAMADRYGNLHDSLPAQHETQSDRVTIVNGRELRGVAFGRAVVVARHGALVDTARVTVVPVQGTIVAHASRRYVGDSIGIVTVNLDGSAAERVAVEWPQPRDYGMEEPPGRVMHARWMVGGNAVVYDQSTATRSGNYEGSGARVLFTSDLTGMPRRLLQSSFYVEAHPDVSPDGAWVYFTALMLGEYHFRLWRARTDGSGIEQLPGATPVGSDTRPAVSPDGSRIAFSGEGRIRVRDIATGALAAVDVRGTSPRWSPTGEWIAYVDAGDHSGYSGALRVVRADGSGDRQLVTGIAYAPVLDWSPDGRYIVAARSTYGGLELVEVATGTSVVLPYGWRFSAPAWRPAPPAARR